MEVIDPNHQKMSVRKQYEILAVPRSSVYYQPIPEKPENVTQCNLRSIHEKSSSMTTENINVATKPFGPTNGEYYSPLRYVKSNQEIVAFESVGKMVRRALISTMFFMIYCPINVREYSCSSWKELAGIKNSGVKVSNR